MIKPLVSLIAFAFAFASGTTEGQEPNNPTAAALPGAAACLAQLEQASAQLPADSERVNRPDGRLLGDVCPDLAAEIDAGVWGESLLDLRAAELTAEPLLRLVELIERYGRETGSASGLAPNDLAAVVDGLRPFEPLPELSAWDRIMQWLQERLGLDRVDAGNRLLEWLRSLEVPDRWIRLIIFSFGAAVVLLALAVAVHELRRSGALAFGTESRWRSRSLGAAEDSPQRPASFEDLRRAPPHKQPVLLLALILDRLRAKYSSSIRASLTHRELVAVADMLAPARRASFESVVAAAERITFADWTPAAADIEPLLADGELLLDELSDEPEARL